MGQTSGTRRSNVFLTIQEYINDKVPAGNFWPLVMLAEMLKDAPHICLQHPQEIARALIIHEPQLLETILPRIRPLAGALLYQSGIVDHGPRGTGLYLLNNGSDLSIEERDQLISLCQSRIHEMKQQPVKSSTKTGCPFCQPAENLPVLDENLLCLLIADKYPVAEDHSLVIPRRHVETWFDLNPAELLSANQLLQAHRSRLLKQDSSISGFNIGMNCGHSAGQTIFHAHVHLIPRRDGDQDNPRGGVRKIFPIKADYLS